MLKPKRILEVTMLTLILTALGAAQASAQGTLFVRNQRVGIGTDNPQSPLHIFQTVGEPDILMETLDTAAVKFELRNSAGEWQFIAGPVGNFNFNRVGVAGNQFIFTTGGDLIIQGSLSQGSSRSMKQDFQPLDGQEILAKVSQLPLLEWSYRNEETRHAGPMAEDFGSTFGLGDDSSHLSPGDVAGVALAAIQGLNQKLDEKEKHIEALEKEVQELRAMVTQLAAK